MQFQSNNELATNISSSSTPQHSKKSCSVHNGIQHSVWSAVQWSSIWWMILGHLGTESVHAENDHTVLSKHTTYCSRYSVNTRYQLSGCLRLKVLLKNLLSQMPVVTTTNELCIFVMIFYIVSFLFFLKYFF